MHGYVLERWRKREGRGGGGSKVCASDRGVAPCLANGVLLSCLFPLNETTCPGTLAQVLRPLTLNLGHQHSKTRQMTLQVRACVRACVSWHFIVSLLLLSRIRRDTT